jgi:hypothetical protein
VTGPRGWPPLRQHGKHRATPPVIKETDLSSSLAASLPGPMPRPVTQDADPGPVVQCGWCKATGYASQIPDIGRGPRCADTDACVKRWNCGHGKPVSLLPPGAHLPESLPLVAEPEPASALPELPPAQEAALVRFNAATDEQDAAERAAGELEAGETAQPRSEDEEPAQDSVPEPAPPVAEGLAQDNPAED